MRTASRILTAAAILAFAVSAHPQANPIADAVANRLVAKYQSSSCDQLAQERAAPKSATKEAAIQRAGTLLRQDAALRTELVGKVAAPIVDKMIVCGFIP